MKTSIPQEIQWKLKQHDQNLLIKAKRRQEKEKGLEARTKSKRAGLQIPCQISE